MPPRTSLAQTALHIKIHPPPKSLTSRLQIHSILSKFGAPSYFLSLAYHNTRLPNALWVIMPNASAAHAALSASPIRFTSTTSSPSPNLQDPASSPAEVTHYELRISPSDYDHLAGIRDGALYRGYTPVPTSRSAIAADLAERIPSGIAKGGMCDWVTDGVGTREGDGRMRGGGSPGMPLRIREKVAAKREEIAEAMLECIRV